MSERRQGAECDIASVPAGERAIDQRASEAGLSGKDALRHRQAEYQWPVASGAIPEVTALPESSSASMDVEAWIDADGTIRAWHYHAQLRESDTSDRSDIGRVDQPGPVPFLYRHVHAYVSLDQRLATMSAHAHVFARESFLDEIAHEFAVDPVAMRLRHLDVEHDRGATEIIRQVTERAAWGASTWRQRPPEAGWLRGRGFAFDGAIERESERVSSHAESPTARQGGADPRTWAAWVVDIDVNRETGDIAVRRVVAGQASGDPEAPMVSGMPAAQIEAAIVRATGSQLLARPAHDETDGAHGVGHSESAPAISHELVVRSGSDHAESSSPVQLDPRQIEDAAAPAAAAIANALFDATGVRFRAPPFAPEQVRRALAQVSTVTLADAPAAKRQPSRWRRWLIGGGVGGAMGGLIGLACALLPGPSSIAPVQHVDTSLWSASTLERGRQIALAGDCAVCHTAPGGRTNAGGLALETPFGTVWSTNITPDAETGIGSWSYEAFERAMRRGISRDGSHLYPAFPYTAFAKMSESDMMALYAYLMSQPAVKSTPPKTRLPFPMNQRRLVAGWNWMFHDARSYEPNPTRSALWNRGKYLVDGAGHCGACHTPRNVLGAEKGGFAYLAGGSAEGWDAPSLVAARGKPGSAVPWTEAALFDYLRTGFSAEHGVAAGPMGPVVAGLADLPESDVRAIAHYIASLSPQVGAAEVNQVAAQRIGNASARPLLGMENGRRTFETACAVCHAESGGVGHLGVRPLMGLNTSVSQASPDNLLHVLLRGIDQPATGALGYMPGFGDVFDDRQIAELAEYIRARYAPGEPAWRDLEAASARVRSQHH
ncbi:c-type cytochrome [Burkholderia cepacia]